MHPEDLPERERRVGAAGRRPEGEERLRLRPPRLLQEADQPAELGVGEELDAAGGVGGVEEPLQGPRRVRLQVLRRRPAEDDEGDVLRPDRPEAPDQVGQKLIRPVQRRRERKVRVPDLRTPGPLPRRGNHENALHGGRV